MTSLSIDFAHFLYQLHDHTNYINFCPALCYVYFFPKFTFDLQVLPLVSFCCKRFVLTHVSLLSVTFGLLFYVSSASPPRCNCPVSSRFPQSLYVEILVPSVTV